MIVAVRGSRNTECARTDKDIVPLTVKLPVESRARFATADKGSSSLPTVLSSVALVGVRGFCTEAAFESAAGGVPAAESGGVFNPSAEGTVLLAAGVLGS